MEEGLRAGGLRARLLSVLGGIEQSGLSTGLKKALAYRAVDMAMQGCGETGGPVEAHRKLDELEAYEEAMSAARLL